MSSIAEVKNYWDSHPLFSYEVNYPLGSAEFFKAADHIRFDEVDRFAMKYWDFGDSSKDKTILEIGCGPGFLVRFYAYRGYRVTAIDLSIQAAKLTKKSLSLYSICADVLQNNAEYLSFKDNSFDYIVSSGVLHHTPDTVKAVLEAHRVLKPGGRAKVTLYYKNILLQEPFWHLTKLLSRAMCRNIPGRDNLVMARDPDEFIKFYDGDTNPIGKGYTLKEARRLLSGPFTWLGHEIHFFPARFMPRWLPVTKTIHRYFDGKIGTMIYVNLMKT